MRPNNDYTDPNYATHKIIGVPTISPLSFPDLSALNKSVFPQIGEKFLPGYGQDAVGKGTYRVLADED